jgi:hypothetical protein
VCIAIASCSWSVGCGSAPPAPAPRPKAPITARTPTPEDIAIPATLELSQNGREAVQTLGRAEAFGGSAVGYSGVPVPEVAALRTLLSEKRAAEALLLVIERGSLPGQLMALSGLYYADHASFASSLTRYRAMTTPVRVLHDGCIRGEDLVPIAELIEADGAMRLLGPSDTLAAWAQRNPGVTRVVYDIAGGSYPLVLRGAR